MLHFRRVERLILWFDREKRSFPWRLNPNPYWVWLAEVMSQQTQMATLVPYFERFIDRFPTVTALAQASEAEVLAAWAGLGYYSRAVSLHKTAKILVQSLDATGQFPQTYDGWLELPGIGPYTAAAITSQCFGVYEPVVDGNVTRVFSRLLAKPNAHTLTFRKDLTTKLRSEILKYDPSKFNQALMELGALICRPKSPVCNRCPLAICCQAYHLGKVDRFPGPKLKKQTVVLKPRVLVVARRQKGKLDFLLTRRNPGHWYPGMWDFQTELGGSKEPIIKMDISKSASRLAVVTHTITHHKIFLEGWVDWNLKVSVTSNKKWLSLDEILSEAPSVPIASTARKMLKEFLSMLP